jgi:hypothetical protein
MDGTDSSTGVVAADTRGDRNVSTRARLEHTAQVLEEAARELEQEAGLLRAQAATCYQACARIDELEAG